MHNTILRIDASARTTGSTTRALNDQVIASLTQDGPVSVANRDLTEALPQINEDWVGANFTAPDERSTSQVAALALSETLVAELKAADILLIGLPIYNFSLPASFKAWIDQVARVGETFRYGENGPEGLLTGKRAIVTVASGGTKVGSELDFATDYLRHVLGFLGVSDVTRDKGRLRTFRATRRLITLLSRKPK